LEINDGDLVHFQWTGSNTHNNNNPGGDGQTGDAGEGQGGLCLYILRFTSLFN